MNFEAGLAAKWLELLKEIAPERDASGGAFGTPLKGGLPPLWPRNQAVAPSLGMEVHPINMRDAAEIESALAAFARTPRASAFSARPVARSLAWETPSFHRRVAKAWFHRGPQSRH